MEVLGAVASVIAVVQLTSKLISVCSEYVDHVKDARHDIERLLVEIQTLSGVLRTLQQSTERDETDGKALSATKSVAVQCFADLEDLERQLRPGKMQKAMKKFGKRALKWPFSSKQVDNMIATLERHKATINLALSADVKTSLDDMKQDQHLSRLPFAADAAFNSALWQHFPPCLPETRVELLQQIREWSDSTTNESAPIYWLSGMAGTGKSTISRTLAKEWFEEARLGGSFFFSRGHAELSHIKHLFSTIAFQLSNVLPKLKPHISKAIAQNPDVFQRGLREQWQHLVFQPLSALKQTDGSSSAGPLILLIDALDECDGEKDVQLMLELLAQLQELDGTIRLRAFITSRPELPIRLGFKKIEKAAYQDFVLHDIAESVIQHDISLFLRHEFDRIKHQRELLDDWPDRGSIERVTQRADRLFIYAATVCRFMDHPKFDPMERLSDVLGVQVGSQSPTGVLDAMYTQVLSVSLMDGCDEEDARRISSRFRTIIGTIILLFDSLSTLALSSLLGISERLVRNTLDCLGSVLDASKSDAIRLLHPSFREFLLDDRRCTDIRFSIDRHGTQNDIFLGCLGVMSTHLKRDICGLEKPDIRKTGTEHILKSRLSSAVQYACIHWVQHLKECSENETSNHCRPVLEFLQKHFLHWLEALSFMNKISDGVQGLRVLESIVTDEELHIFIHDARRFLLKHRSVIESAPLQLYYSALIFTPRMGKVRTQYWDEAPSWIENRTIDYFEANWDPLIQVCEGHFEAVKAVIFSPDGHFLASISDDSHVRLWDSSTGACLSTLKGHSSWVTAVAFSPDSKHLASASFDKSIKLWDQSTGTCQTSLEGHSTWVTALVFSPSQEGIMLASASYDKTVKLWDPVTGSCQRTLEGHSNGVNAVAFSPGGNLLASGSSDTTVRVWNPSTGVCRATLQGHRSWIAAVQFSPDSKRLASASCDSTVRLWDPLTGACQATLNGHSNWVTTLAFSPDSKLLASGSNDCTVRLWDPSTGSCQNTLRGHSGKVNAVLFSPEGKLVASGSWDHTVKLWDITTGACRSTLTGHSNSVHSVAFVPDGKLLASGSHDTTIRLWDPYRGAEARESIFESHSKAINGMVISSDGNTIATGSSDQTIRLWDPSTGKCRATLRGHSNWVMSVAFSPDGNLFASGSYDDTVRLWDPSTGACLSTLEGHSSRVSKVAFSPDGTLLVSGSNDKTVRVWESPSGSFRRALEGHTGIINSVAFSHDGNLLASTSADDTIRIWDLSTGACQSTIHGYFSVAFSIAFSPDSKLLALATRRTIQVLDIERRAEVHSVNPNRRTSKISFSSDGAYLETGQRIFPFQSGAAPRDQPLICLNGNWVQWKGVNLLWLPVDLRPSHSDIIVQGNMLAMGHRSGKVTILAFHDDTAS